MSYSNAHSTIDKKIIFNRSSSFKMALLNSDRKLGNRYLN